MKKLIFINSLLLFISLVSAQTTETYPNSQRYWFDTLRATESSLCSCQFSCPHNDYTDCEQCDYGILTHRFNTTRSGAFPVYGIAIIYTMSHSHYSVYDCNDTVHDIRWDFFINQFSSCTGAVYFMTNNNSGDSLFYIVDSATIDFETTAVCNNRFVMPGFDTTCCPYYRVIEVYFKHPVLAIDTFWIGTKNTTARGSLFPEPYFRYWCIGLTLDTTFTFLHNNGDGTMTAGSISGSHYIGNQYLNLWGASFPIIAPPPCFKPAYPRVSNIGAWHATVRWDIPVGVQFFNLEYGPAGFTPGTGTTILNITADSCLLSGLSEQTQYDVYVTSWCNYHNTFSDASSVSFSTHPLCDTAYGLGATRTNTIIRAWWQQPLRADFSEIEYGPRDFTPGSGTLISPVHANAAHSCVVVIDSLTPGTAYTLRVRSWCSPTSSFSDWVQMDISTVASPVQPDAPVMSLSPNPAEGSVLVSLSDVMSLLEFRDLQGKLLLSLAPNSNTAVVDIASLPAGVYIVTATTPSGSASRKLTVK